MKMMKNSFQGKEERRKCSTCRRPCKSNCCWLAACFRGWRWKGTTLRGPSPRRTSFEKRRMRSAWRSWWNRWEWDGSQWRKACTCSGATMALTSKPGGSNSSDLSHVNAHSSLDLIAGTIFKPPVSKSFSHVYSPPSLGSYNHLPLPSDLLFPRPVASRPEPLCLLESSIWRPWPRWIRGWVW